MLSLMHSPSHRFSNDYKYRSVITCHNKNESIIRCNPGQSGGWGKVEEWKNVLLFVSTTDWPH